MMYRIFSDLDYEKICYATLKKVFSTTLFPRVLLNIQNDVFEKNFKNFAYFECFFVKNSQKFAKYVHNKYFDIGLFFFKKGQNLCLKIYDGNGYLASSFTKNIFDFVFSLSIFEFDKYKKQIKKSYKSVSKKKLLVQTI